MDQTAGKMWKIPHSVLIDYGFASSCQQEQLGGTRNDNVLVQDGPNKCVIRRRYVDYAHPKWVEFDHEAAEYLMFRGAPVVSPLRNSQGNTFCSADGCVYEAYPFIQGKQLDPENVDQMRLVARGLARFHQAGSCFPRVFLKGGSLRAETCPDRLAKVIQQLKCARADLYPALRYLQIQLDDAARLLTDEKYEAIPKTLNHGDAHPANVLVKDSLHLTFIDLDWMALHPPIYDLAFALLFFTCDRPLDIDSGNIWSLSQPFSFNTPKMALFLQEYQQEAGSLTRSMIYALIQQVKLTWLHCRIDGAKKVKVADMRQFLERELTAPFEWLKDNEEWFFEQQE